TAITTAARSSRARSSSRSPAAAPRSPAHPVSRSKRATTGGSPPMAGTPTTAPPPAAAAMSPSKSARPGPRSPPPTTPPPAPAGPVGQTFKDKATLAGLFGQPAGGTVTWKLYDNAKCEGQPLASDGPVSVSADGTYETPTGTAISSAGSYYWVASYSGDHNNK